MTVSVCVVLPSSALSLHSVSEHLHKPRPPVGLQQLSNNSGTTQTRIKCLKDETKEAGAFISESLTGLAFTENLN